MIFIVMITYRKDVLILFKVVDFFLLQDIQLLIASVPRRSCLRSFYTSATSFR
jgi:hypothetical protein